MAASEIAIEDTPRRTCLKRSIRQLSKEIVIKNKKLKSLQQTIRRKNKRIANMQTIINDIKNQNFVDEETSVSLLESFGKHKDLVTNWTKKKIWEKKFPKNIVLLFGNLLCLCTFFLEKLMNMSEINLIQYYHIHARLANGIVISMLSQGSLWNR